jgi:hypothetical protein
MKKSRKAWKALLKKTKSRNKNNKIGRKARKRVLAKIPEAGIRKKSPKIWPPLSQVKEKIEVDTDKKGSMNFLKRMIENLKQK